MTPMNVSVAYILISLAIGYWGRTRKFGFWGYFFASLMLTPAIGALLVIAASPRTTGGLGR